MEINFCRRCGARLTTQSAGVYLCEQGHHVYYKSYPAVLILLLNDKNEVLIAVRGREPEKGTYDLPGGFCDLNESFDETAIRELKEETGLEASDCTPLEYLSSDVDTYLYEGEDQPAIGLTFMTRLKTDAKVTAQDDVAELIWIPLTEVDTTKIGKGFNNARTAIMAAQKRFAG